MDVVAAPVSLYFDLERDNKANLEAVARAASAYANAIQELAYIIDPSIELRIELVNGTEGSLSLNSILKSLGYDKPLTRRNLIAIACTAALWFSGGVMMWETGHVLDWMTGQEATAHLSDADKADVAKIVVEALNKQIGRQHVETIYREAQTDPAISGLGGTTNAGQKPSNIVPRSEFPARSTSNHIKHEEISKRTRLTIERVTLVSPVLVPSVSRRWKFVGGEGEFSASMKARKFLIQVLTGDLGIPLAAGIQMDVELETNEIRQGDVWVVTSRDIIEVRRVFPSPRQMNFDLPSEK